MKITEKFDKSLTFDNGGAECRIGLIVLATDLATESDFRRTLKGHSVEFHTTRVQNANPVTLENLRTMGPQLGECAARLLPGMALDVIAYSCTSATVALGYETVEAQVAQGRDDVPLVTPATAALNGFRAMGAKKIALFTPYTAPVGQEVADYFEKNGIEVLKQTHLGIESDADMALLSPESIKQAVHAAHHPNADAVFISCTAIRAMETLDDLERELKTPCLSSIQCLLWDALQQGGYGKSFDIGGSLLTGKFNGHLT